MTNKAIAYLQRHGPLGTLRWTNRRLQDLIPRSCSVLGPLDRLLCRFQHYLDGAFDRHWGTDTSGVIPLSELAITSPHVVDGAWYEPMSGSVFAQMMASLPVDLRRFTFTDFGSGKGRILLLASTYGFSRIIGVEFSPELHHIASRNVEVWKRRQRTGGIEPICIDAVDFPIPSGPLVCFFFSPFKRATLQQVLTNITASYRERSRPIALLFYGHRPDTLDIFFDTPFGGRELFLRPDWRRFFHYRSFLFTSREFGDRC